MLLVFPAREKHSGCDWGQGKDAVGIPCEREAFRVWLGPRAGGQGAGAGVPFWALRTNQ